MRAVQTTAAQIAQLIAAGHDVVVTHGNGPQVGLGMLRSDLAAGDAAVRAPAVPLDWLDAESEGSLGYILQQAIGNQPALVGRPAPAAVVTQVVVDAADPAFAAPSKPVGAYYTQTEAEARCTQAGDGWVMREQPGGQGWRRVVPSPRPQRVVELAAVEALLAHGVTAVCLGGGGIPVVEADDSGAEEARGNAADVVGRGDQRLVTRPLRGVAAVVDKDASSVLLADALGCDAVVFSTAVPCVYRDFGTPDQTPLGVLSADHAEALLADGQFGTGSMAPKVAAAVDFVTARRGGGGNVGKGGGHPAQRRRVAHVCEPSAIFDAVTISTDGQVGTTVVAAAETR